MDAVVANDVVDHLRDSVAPGAIPRPGVPGRFPAVRLRQADQRRRRVTAMSPPHVPEVAAAAGSPPPVDDRRGRCRHSGAPRWVSKPQSVQPRVSPRLRHVAGGRLSAVTVGTIRGDGLRPFANTERSARCTSYGHTRSRQRFSAMTWTCVRARARRCPAALITAAVTLYSPGGRLRYSNIPSSVHDRRRARSCLTDRTGRNPRQFPRRDYLFVGLSLARTIRFAGANDTAGETRIETGSFAERTVVVASAAPRSTSEESSTFSHHTRATHVEWLFVVQFADRFASAGTMCRTSPVRVPRHARGVSQHARNARGADAPAILCRES